MQPQQLPPVFPGLAALPVPPPKSEETLAAGATEGIFLLSRTEVQGEVVESALRPDDRESLRRSERSRRQRQPQRQSEKPDSEQQRRGQRQGQRQRRASEGAAAVVDAEPPAQPGPSGDPAPWLSPAFGAQQAPSVLPWSQEGPVPVLAAAEIEMLEGLFQD